MQGMNRIKFLLLITSVSLIWGSTESYASDVNQSSAANIALGAKEWTANCARCHNYIPTTEYSAENWQIIMSHMRLQAGLTGQEARNIYLFLSAQSPKNEESMAHPHVADVTLTPPSTSNLPNNTTSATNAENKTQNQHKATPQNTANSTMVTAENTTTQSDSHATKTTSSSTGAAIYKQTCVACHGANGKGSVPGAPDFTKAHGSLAQSDAVLLSHIENGFKTPGSPMVMPPKGGNSKLTADEIKSVLGYIREKFSSK